VTAENLEKKRVLEIVAFEYGGFASAPQPDCVAWELEEVDSRGNALAPKQGSTGVEGANLAAEIEKRLGTETRRSFEAGRQRGIEEGRTAEREAQTASQASIEGRLAAQFQKLMEDFAGERDRYLHAVEHEVVKLALGVAARILRREAQMDPLLLLGAVRVALGQLSATTRVKVRVPAGDLELWTEAVALLPSAGLKPRLVAGDGMKLGECMLETELGSVDLGVRAQLSEIERGFLDRAVMAAHVPEEQTV